METQTILNLGKERAAFFAGCIYANYLVWMNNGYSGYTNAALDKCQKNQERNILALTDDEFAVWANGVVKAINSNPETTTEKYYQKAYAKWFFNQDLNVRL